MDRLTVRVPATTANLGPGFDSLGLALCLFNTVEVWHDEEEPHLIEGEGTDSLPRGADNLVRRAMAALAGRARAELPRLGVRQVNAIPLARGLGSSSAAIVGGMVAANELLGRPLAPDRVFNAAVRVEGHPDNVAPALFGGLTVCHWTGDGMRHLRVEPVDPPQAVVAIPDYEIATERAREVLPDMVAHWDATRNVGYAATVAAAFATGQYKALRSAMRDHLHQPFRAPLIRGMHNAIFVALSEGALGAAVSGSGPSIVAFARGKQEAVAEAMREALADSGVNAETRILDICTEGATVVEAE